MKKYLELFKDGFDATIAEKTKVENRPYVGYSPGEGVLYTVIPKINEVHYYITELVKKSIPVPLEGYGEVDLGLSVKWADRNVGAKNPLDNGAYFSWGNVEGVVSNGTSKKSEDDMIRIILIQQGTPADTITQELIDTLKLEAGENLKLTLEAYSDRILISGTKFDENTYSTTLGGQYTGSTLDAEHDAATVNMGSDWRMPTSAEEVELVENTDHYYIGEDGNIVAESELDDSIKLRSICFVKKGEAFDYNKRTNFIEFPFAGYCYNSYLIADDEASYVWSSSADKSNAKHAYYSTLHSDGDLVSSNRGNRYFGHSVRGVRA